MKAVEIERKFLVEAPPDLADADSTEIHQGYLCLASGSARAEVRIRRRGEDHTLTVKGGEGRARIEEELDLDADAFAALWPLTEGRRLVKQRHVFEHADLEFEVDVYEGPLEGLIVVEVEFDTEEEASRFVPPDWVGPEVTGDRRYLNETLAAEGLPQV